MEPIEWLARRRALGLSQAAIAEMIGITQATWARYEQGARGPQDPVGVHISVAEIEELLLNLTDELAQTMEHAAGVQDSPSIQVRTYSTNEAWWAVDARARQGQWPAELHQVALARAAAEVRLELGIHIKIIDGAA